LGEVQDAQKDVEEGTDNVEASNKRFDDIEADYELAMIDNSRCQLIEEEKD